MSGYNDYSDVLDDDGHEEQTGRGLRAQLEATLEANRKLAERLDKLEKKETVTGLLESKGLDPAVAQLIPADADPSKWLDDFGHLFGKTLDEGAAAAHEETDPDLQAEQEAMQSIQNIGTSGDSTTVVPDPLDRLNGVQSEADLLALINEAGGGSTGGGVFR